MSKIDDKKREAQERRFKSGGGKGTLADSKLKEDEKSKVKEGIEEGIEEEKPKK